MATMIVGERGPNALFSMLNPGDLTGDFTGLGWDLGPLASLVWRERSATVAIGDLRAFGSGLPDVVYRLEGSGFTYNPDGVPTGGTLNRIVAIDTNTVVFDARDFALGMNDFVALVFQAARPNDQNAANFTFKSTIFSGDDNIVGASGRDALSGYDGNDTLRGNAGNDALIGARGNDFIDGGEGNADTAGFFTFPSEYRLVSYAGVTAVLPLTADARGDGVDKLVNVEFLYFAEKEDLINGVNVPINSLPIENFNPLDYVASYGDLIQTFGVSNPQGAFDHYVYTGFFEGRRTTFNSLEYIASYNDLMQAYGANAVAGASHYMSSGRAEGRTIDFNALEYIASYGDLVQAYGANTDAGAAHFITSGLREGRQATFDGLEYIASYGDLIRTFGTNAEAGTTHFIQRGVNEGRTVTFDPVAYLAKYADLQAAFGSDTESATVHFIQHGFFEGRTV
jgi:Ca2+-binding RTX toxin-like protein